jgi:translation initiation factor IF-1
MKLSSFVLGAVFAVAVIAVVLLIAGVSFHTPIRGQGAALYDPAHEVVLKGIVEQEQEFACPVSEGELGDHVMLKTADGVVQVHLAAGRIMRSQNIKFAPGDNIEVLGSKVRIAGNDSVIARQITRGDVIYVLRDQSGKLLVVQ